MKQEEISEMREKAAKCKKTLAEGYIPPSQKVSLLNEMADFILKITQGREK